MVAAVADTVEEPTEGIEDDSETDENIEIIEIEKRDFDDVEGIDSDIRFETAWFSVVTFVTL
jgi:hypothetical protein